MSSHRFPLPYSSSSPPLRDLDLGSHSGQSSPLPATLRAFIFIARIIQLYKLHDASVAHVMSRIFPVVVLLFIQCCSFSVLLLPKLTCIYLSCEFSRLD